MTSKAFFVTWYSPISNLSCMILSNQSDSPSNLNKHTHTHMIWPENYSQTTSNLIESMKNSWKTARVLESIMNLYCISFGGMSINQKINHSSDPINHQLKITDWSTLAICCVFHVLIMLNWNLESCCGIVEITGPYLWTLSYSSNRGTARSLRFFGTAKYSLSDK